MGETPQSLINQRRYSMSGAVRTYSMYAGPGLSKVDTLFGADLIHLNTLLELNLCRYLQQRAMHIAQWTLALEERRRSLISNAIIPSTKHTYFSSVNTAGHSMEASNRPNAPRFVFLARFKTSQLESLETLSHLRFHRALVVNSCMYFGRGYINT